MKKLLLFIPILILFLNGFSQNAPIAVNDTIFIDFNDSTYIQSINAGMFIANDSDADGDVIQLDSSYYGGAAFFSDTIQVVSSTLLVWRFSYTPSLNFYGLDSIRYVIRDDEVQARYDTAWIYLKVKHAEFEQLDLNNINARLGLYSLFNDVENGLPSFEAPKGSGSHSIYAANLWIGGKSLGSAYVNGETFGSNLSSNNTLTSFGSRSGPIMDSIHYTEYDYNWDRLWKVNNADLVYHQNNWNVVGYQPIEVIANWPAHGDTTKGQAYYLAPFVDNNNDGAYNPLDGDYPKIKGQQAIYNIYNDVRAVTGSNGSMITEIHYMAYAYHCPSDSALNNTIFIDYTIYNRSNLTYDSTYVGMWTDFDVGNSSDDYVACDVARSTFYGYNGDDNDENANGISGYGNYPPAQGVTFLQGAKQDADGIDNPYTPIIQDAIDSSGTLYTGLGTGFGDGFADNEHWGMENFTYYNNAAWSGGIQTQLDYYNYLRGIWGDSTQMVWGGNGHVSGGGTVPTNYLFPGISDPLWYGTEGIATTPTNWSETTAGNPPGDRRGMGSTGPFTFEPDSSIELTLAFVFGRDYQTTGAQAGVVVMQERIDSIRHYFNTDFVSACGGSVPVSVKERLKNNTALSVYPNPFTNELTVNYELKNNNATLTIYNLIGENIYTATLFENSTQLSLTNYDKGIYFIKIIDGDKSITQKIVKQ